MSKRGTRANKSPQADRQGGWRAGKESGREDRPLTLALPRGRILDEAIELFGRAGMDLAPLAEARSTRRLIVPVPKEGLQRADRPGYGRARRTSNTVPPTWA